MTHKPEEIEVTPEMIAAGREVISGHWLDFVGPTGYRMWDLVLSETFRAMTAAKRR